ncbi:MAG TPA: ABC transporter permease [Jatrophihabitantaceae bacterium]|nr:ABC transporter permease [Jatrophihabitantaceae bacterium]
MNALRLMHLRQLRRQPLRVALAVLAIAAGVTLTVAVLVARSSLDKSFDAYNTAIGGDATLRVISRYDHGGIDTSTLEAVEHTEGVQAAVPLVLTVTQVNDRHGHDVLVAVVGADCRAQTLFGSFGCDPNAVAAAKDTDPPLVGSALRNAAGSAGVLRTDVGDRPLDHAVVSHDLDRFNGGLVAVYPLPVSQTLFVRPNGLDAIYIVPKPGTSPAALKAALTNVVGPANRVLEASDSSNAVSYVSNQLLPLMLLLSLFALVVGGQLVFNTMTLSLEERRRELAIEAAIGGTPRTVTLGVLVEAAILGVAGGVLGIFMGLVAARPFVDNLSTYAEQQAGLHLGIHATASSFVVGIAIGLIASVAAALVPARRAARLDIAGELVDRSRRHDGSAKVSLWRAALYTALCAAGLVIAWRGSRNGGMEPWQPPMLYLSVLVTWFASFRLAPAIVPFLVRMIEKLRVFQRGPARVAVSNLLTEGRRTAVVVTAVGIAVGLAFTLSGVFPGMQKGAAMIADANAAGRLTVLTLTPNNTGAIDAKVSPATQAAIAQLPGVARVDRYYWLGMDYPGVGPVGLSAYEGTPPHFDVFKGDDPDTVLGRGDVMIGPGLARALNLHPGSHLDLPGRYGPVSMTVGGIWDSPDNLGRSIVMPTAVRDQLIGPRPASGLYVTPAPGVSIDEVQRTILDAHLADNLKVWNSAQLTTEFAESFKTFLDPFWLLARGMLVVAFIATTSTLLLAAVQRRAEHGLLAAVGMPPGDLGRMVLVEAGLFGVLGTISGFVGGILGLAAFSFASGVLTGLTIPFSLHVGPLFLYGALATLCVLVGAALPAWRTSQLDPIVALRYE